MFDALVLQDLVVDELRQRAETGFDVAHLRTQVDSGTSDSTDLARVLDNIGTVDRHSPWPYVEPDDLDDIMAELPFDDTPPTSPVPDLADRIHAAWLGRVAGCILGKPLERGDQWTTARIRTYLELAGSYPLANYVPVLDPMPAGYELNPSWPTTTLGNIRGAARDDDIDYTIVNLLLLEQHGPRLTTENIGNAWLYYLPCLQTYTAERAAYRNLIDGLRPPDTAVRRNPYREWIGAAIRADVFGYVHPARPRAAALFAYRDARLSHTANGIYAEMWIAALVAQSFVSAEPAQLLSESLRHVPRRSRLAEAVDSVIDSHRRGLSWAEAMDTIQQRYGHYTWVHAVNNACVVAAALLWGGNTWTDAVTLAVQAGWDTDSNGATVGSIMGAALGRHAIPDRFSAPLHDTVRPGLFGLGPISICELAARTTTLTAAFRDSD